MTHWCFGFLSFLRSFIFHLSSILDLFYSVDELGFKALGLVCIFLEFLSIMLEMAGAFMA